MVRDLLRYRALVRNLVVDEPTLKYRDPVRRVLAPPNLQGARAH